MVDTGETYLSALFNKLVPNMMKTTKEIMTLQIDQQRNLLYVLCKQTNGRAAGQCVIQIHDLGMLGDMLTEVVRLEQYKIIESLHKLLQIDERGQSTYEIAARYEIIGIIPLQHSESEQCQMVVMTKTGDRIFIRFD